jgi:hypothetical protein
MRAVQFTVWRLIDDDGNIVSREDDYGHFTPIDFDSVDEAQLYSFHFLSAWHGPKTERDQKISDAMNRAFSAINYTLGPNAEFWKTRSLPSHSGKTIQFFSHGETK